MLETSARRPRASATIAVAVVLALLLAGCSGADETAVPAPAPTPIGELDTGAMQLPRIAFCPLVPAKAVTGALGGRVSAKAAYGNGDEELLQGVGQDAVHEIGCSWTGASGTSAGAWVFASPVTPSFARTVLTSGRAAKGCRTVAGPRFGDPSTTQVCQLADGRRRIRHAGLFGQTWLTCELATSALDQASLRASTDRWCVQIVNALAATS